MQAGNESLPRALLGAAKRIAGALGWSRQLRVLAPFGDRQLQDMGPMHTEVMTGKTKSLGHKDALAGEPWPAAIIHDDLRAA